MSMLNKLSYVIARAICIALAMASTAQAAVIGRGTVENSIGIADILREPNFLVEIIESDVEGFELSRTPVFSKTLTESDIGIPFIVTPNNTSNFNHIASLLTNGVIEEIYFEVTGIFGLGSAVGTAEFFLQAIALPISKILLLIA